MEHCYIDLHMHSTTSDGTTAAEELLEQVDQSIRAHGDSYERIILALTDHDTTAGYAAFRTAAEGRKDVTVIPGVEISTNYKEREIHILGYGIDPEDAVFNEKLELYRDGRALRNAAIFGKFADLGIVIPEEELEVEEGKSLGRPQIARWLMDHGYVESVQEAFDKYLAEGAQCYVDRVKPSITESVAMIRQAGGRAVLAHPMQYKFLDPGELEELVQLLREAGLTGIECYYTEFSGEEIAFVESLAARYGLFCTGGSDYHGENKPTYELGYGWGHLNETMDKIQIEALL